MPLKKKSKPGVLRTRKSGVKPLKRRLKKRSGRSKIWLGLGKGKKGRSKTLRKKLGKPVRRKLRRRKGVLLRRRRTAAVQPPPQVQAPQPEAAPVDTAALFQEGYNETYQEGFNAGFAQGFEDGHKLAYQQQELKA